MVAQRWGSTTDHVFQLRISASTPTSQIGTKMMVGDHDGEGGGGLQISYLFLKHGPFDQVQYMEFSPLLLKLQLCHLWMQSVFPALVDLDFAVDRHWTPVKTRDMDKSTHIYLSACLVCCHQTVTAACKVCPASLGNAGLLWLQDAPVHHLLNIPADDIANWIREFRHSHLPVW